MALHFKMHISEEKKEAFLKYMLESCDAFFPQVVEKLQNDFLLCIAYEQTTFELYFIALHYIVPHCIDDGGCS